jgi:hypothetical protein
MFPGGPVFSRVLAAEFFKASHRLPLLFWGFVFVPICSFAADIFILSNPIHLADMAPRVNLLLLLSRALEIGSSPLAQVFFIVAAAVIFGSEYDSETWRLLAPRARRTHWIWAKVLLYAAGVLCSLTLVAVGASFCALLESVTRFVPITWQANGGAPVSVLAAVFGISWLELLLLGLVTGVLAVASRSVLIPAISVILAAFCQSILIDLVRLASVASDTLSSTAKLALLPWLAAEVGRFFAAHAEVSPGIYITAREASIGLASLFAWISCTLLLTLVWFGRQEFSRE